MMKTNNTKKRGLRYWLNLLLAALIFGSLFYWQIIVYSLIQPAKAPINGFTPADIGLIYEDITLVAHDGIDLRGWYIPSQNRAAVILLHGYGANRLGVMHQAQMLSGNGFGVLLYDQRACGESQGEKRTWGWRDVYDVPSALSFLHNRPDIDYNRIGIFGASTGGEIAIGTAALNEEIQAVVADGPGFSAASDLPPRRNFGEWFITLPNPLILKLIELETYTKPPIPLHQAIPGLAPRPLLLISTGTGIERYQNEHYYELANQPVEHWNIPEASHNSGMLARWDEYQTRLVTFFRQALLKQE